MTSTVNKVGALLTWTAEAAADKCRADQVTLGVEAEHKGTSDLLQPYVSMPTMPARSTSAHAGGCFGLAFTRQGLYRISCHCTSKHVLRHIIIAAVATIIIRPAATDTADARCAHSDASYVENVVALPMHCCLTEPCHSAEGRNRGKRMGQERLSIGPTPDTHLFVSPSTS